MNKLLSHYLMTTTQYNDLEKKDCLNLLKSHGRLLDEVIIFGILKMKIYSLENFFVQVVYNKNDNKLLDVKALISNEDWNPYLETLDLKDFF